MKIAENFKNKEMEFFSRLMKFEFFRLKIFEFFSLSCLPNWTRFSKPLVMRALNNSKREWCFIPNFMKIKSEIMALAPYQALVVPGKLGKCFDFMYEAAKKNGSVLMYASEKIRNNFRIAKEAVMSNGHAYQYLSRRLQEKMEILKLAAKSRTRRVGRLPNVLSMYNTHRSCEMHSRNVFNLRFHRDFLKDCIKQKYSSMKHMSENCRRDLTFVLFAVRVNGFCLQWAKGRARTNFEITLSAVKNQPFSLQYATAKHKKNKVVVDAARERDPVAIVYSHPNYYQTQIVQNPKILVHFAEYEHFAKKEFKIRTSVLWAAMRVDAASTCKYLYVQDHKLMKDELFCYEALQKNSDSYLYFEEKMKTFENSVMAYDKDESLILCIPQHIRAAVKQHVTHLKHIRRIELTKDSSEDEDEMMDKPLFPIFKKFNNNKRRKL